MIRDSDSRFAGGSSLPGPRMPVAGTTAGTPSLRELVEFRRQAGRSAHMLNNLLTALYCQWDLCFPKAGPSGELPASTRQLKAFLDQIASEVRVLSRACADVPIPEGRGGNTGTVSCASGD